MRGAERRLELTCEQDARVRPSAVPASRSPRRGPPASRRNQTNGRPRPAADRWRARTAWSSRHPQSGQPSQADRRSPLADCEWPSRARPRRRGPADIRRGRAEESSGKGMGGDTAFVPPPLPPENQHPVTVKKPGRARAPTGRTHERTRACRAGAGWLEPAGAVGACHAATTVGSRNTATASSALRIVVMRARIALLAVEGDPDTRRAPFGRRYPGAILERRAMPHVLTVAAFELGHPMTFVVLRESGDAALHSKPV